MSEKIPDDVRHLADCYGFSPEGYVDFAPMRRHHEALRSSPLMQKLEATSEAVTVKTTVTTRDEEHSTSSAQSAQPKEAR